ncbi:MAG: GNAT family N-acetyltransferase [Planctomycetaceae bacterium]|jgi:GNAT superfamily N-acetyltransferase|nr:GNAT family N-acetyltransferase [Phycisphaerales bacterium]MCE2654629.1 GNAT family N-acetyltransferase [Planctomycetaceae bacterium]
MSGDVRVVRAGAGDIPLVVPLFDAYRSFYGQPSDPQAAARFLNQRVLSDESVVLVAMRGFGPRAEGVGFTQLYPTFSSIRLQRDWILNDLFVDASARRLGVARMLLRAAAGFAKAEGAGQLVLSTGCDNQAAQTLYAAMGWERDEAFETWTLPLAE